MTIRHLKIFIQVYRDLNMTAAAKNLFMTQPSVSQAIKELEDYYETILFERLSQRLYVTPSGDKLFHYANHILTLFDELEDSLKNKDHILLRVGVNYTVGLDMIHEIIASFKEEYPNAETRITVNKASVLKEMLRNNNLDFALIEKSKDENDFFTIPFRKDKIVLVCHPDYPVGSDTLTPELLQSHPLLLRENGAGARDMLEGLMKKLGYPITPSWESISATALINAAFKMQGIAALPYESVKNHLYKNELREIHGDFLDLSRVLAVMYHKNKYINAPMKYFIEICQKYYEP